jgi:hypothetical protein
MLVNIRTYPQILIVAGNEARKKNLSGPQLPKVL